MKAKLLSIAAILMMALALPLFTSCGSDDDDQLSAKSASTPTVTAVDLYITASPTEDMLKYADLQLTYTDDQGANKDTVVSTVDFKVSLALTKFPFNGTLTYTCTAKAGVAPADSDMLALRTTFSVQKVITYSDGSSLTLPGYETNNTYSWPGSKLNTWLTAHHTLASCTITIDKDGNTEIKKV